MDVSDVIASVAALAAVVGIPALYWQVRLTRQQVHGYRTQEIWRERRDIYRAFLTAIDSFYEAQCHPEVHNADAEHHHHWSPFMNGLKATARQSLTRVRTAGPAPLAAIAEALYEACAEIWSWGDPCDHENLAPQGECVNCDYAQLHEAFMEARRAVLDDEEISSTLMLRMSPTVTGTHASVEPGVPFSGTVSLRLTSENGEEMVWTASGVHVDVARLIELAVNKASGRSLAASDCYCNHIV